MHTYVVKKGDSLYSISRKMNIPLDVLVKLNGQTGKTIYPNQLITIPKLTLPEGVYGPGSIGYPVRKIQQAMSAIGYALDIDGVFGVQTEDILYHIQMKYPEIPLDGLYGPETRVVMENMLDSGFHIVQNPESIFVLVNKLHGLPHHYIPKDLVIPDIPFTQEGYLPQKLMRADAAVSIVQLFNQAKGNNIILYAVSAYRSYVRQAEIFARNYRSSPEIANFLSSRAGESEHQTGLGVDVTGPSVE
ncbi:MAG: LysM peptidoglycan-binding domain-containing protein [Peptococcaceae bacterium]|nr:LysM peptidoglycan-binding domain-containing protein [Peptococcaceae bacterium]